VIFIQKFARVFDDFIHLRILNIYAFFSRYLCLVDDAFPNCLIQFMVVLSLSLHFEKLTKIEFKFLNLSGSVIFLFFFFLFNYLFLFYFF